MTSCGRHCHRLPAPARDGFQTAASEVGSRGEIIGPRCPTSTEVRSQSSCAVAVLTRKNPSTLLGPPPQKSVSTSALKRALPRRGPVIDSPILVCRNEAPTLFFRSPDSGVLANSGLSLSE